MKTITFHETNYSITLRAEDIVATIRSNAHLDVYLRGCDEPFALRNTDHFDEWYNAIWEEEN